MKSPALLKKKLDYFYQELESKIINRGYTTGFLLGKKAGQNINDAHNKVAWEFCGQTLAWAEGLALVKVHNTILANDKLEIIKPDYDIISLRPEVLFDAKTAQEIKEAHGGGGGQMIIIETPKVPAATVWRRAL